jgi:hypothetical protein
LEARPFLLCVDRFDDREGRVWGVQVGNTWFKARHVYVEVPVHTVFKGPRSRQPKAYLRGIGRVTHELDSVIRIIP